MVQLRGGVEPVPSTATVARSYVGDPTIGPDVVTTNLPRVLIGWIHQDDNPEALINGQLFCSVSRYGQPKLQIFDTSGNRSKQPGDVVFCGVANFTMVRMFHPYWAEAGPDGTLPRDMAWLPKHEDKARLRRLYHELLKDHYGLNDNGEPVYPVPDEDEGADDQLPTVAAASTDDQSRFIPQKEAQGSGDIPDAAPKKRGRPRKDPKAPKPAKPAKRQRQPRPPKSPGPVRRENRKKQQASLFGLDPHANFGLNILGVPLIFGTGLNDPSPRRQATLDDGNSIKSESRATPSINELGNLSPVTTPQPNSDTQIFLEPSPGQEAANPINIDDLDFEELQANVDEQARQFPASDSPSRPSGSQECVNLIDECDEDLERERLLVAFLSQDGNGINTNEPGNNGGHLVGNNSGPSPHPASILVSASSLDSGSAQVPASPLFSNGGVQESIQVDEQDAQEEARRGSSDTLVEMINNNLDMIVPAKHEREVDVAASELVGRGTTLEDAIELD